METKFIDNIGYEGLYKININGDIKNKYGKILKQSICSGGYLYVDLINNLKRNKFRIHRLIAIHFIPNPDNLPLVDHIDGDKLNNNIVNLRWCDRELNNKNSNRIYNCKGSISVRKINDKYRYEATYYIEYNKRKFKSSYDKSVCEEWIEEMKIKYPRNERV